MITLIAAVSKNGVIGNKGKIPWGKIPEDLQHFKMLTSGRPVIMGYETLISIEEAFPSGGILPGRKLFVLTHYPEKVARFKECTALTNTALVFEIAKTDCVFIIGGANVYEQFIEHADVIYLTRIDTEVDGDSFFPEFSTDKWERRSSTSSTSAGYSIDFELWAPRPKRVGQYFMSCHLSEVEKLCGRTLETVSRFN